MPDCSPFHIMLPNLGRNRANGGSHGEGAQDQGEFADKPKTRCGTSAAGAVNWNKGPTEWELLQECSRGGQMHTHDTTQHTAQHSGKNASVSRDVWALERGFLAC
eukprot:GGOE01030906.1.p1 GENE.GGOE01030906.1~~GGOE01030906.1.p1  ORF type:complete len:105 (+),score=7.39 GGOE01030906.1:107-421(+)